MLVERKIANTMDVPRLIAEIQKRPALWDTRHEEHKDRQCIPKLWQEVAEIVGIDGKKKIVLIKILNSYVYELNACLKKLI